MDERRFDDWTRSLTGGVSRRETLRRLAVGAVAGLWAALRGDALQPRTSVLGKGKKKKKKKRKKIAQLPSPPVPPVQPAPPCAPDCASKACGDNDGCGSRCVTEVGCNTGQSCNNAGVCVDDTCTPDCAGKSCGDGDGCSGKCTVQQGCGANQTCINGVCTTGTCNPPSQVCSGACVDLQSDPANCGICGRKVCGPPGDPACNGWECCSGVPSFVRGCLAGAGGWVECQKLHCGGCDSPCEIEGRGCCEGKCVPMLDGEEANGNCGYCGASCDELTTCCGGRCVNTDNDPFNCGNCGVVCEPSHACCHGECKRLGTSENCRGCDDECEDNAVCGNSTVGCVGL
jgi:hypothetical protein